MQNLSALEFVHVVLNFQLEFRFIQTTFAKFRFETEKLHEIAVITLNHLDNLVTRLFDWKAQL